MFRMINKLKNRKGFTLIELIVVLAVLAIIMAIAVPRFLGVQESAKVDADYSTGALIAKAAELYAVQEEDAITWSSNTATVDAADLVDDGYLDEFTLQSKNVTGVTGSGVTVTIKRDSEDSISANFEVNATKASTSFTLYPKTDGDLD